MGKFPKERREGQTEGSMLIKARQSRKGELNGCSNIPVPMESGQVKRKFS